jgi:hypothetical protein
MTTTDIHFTIQNLDGETFQVSMARKSAQKICKQTDNLIHIPLWEQYGLDILKDAIYVHSGCDPCTQQLIQEEELTLSTPLIPLENKVITLIIKPSFQIEFVSPLSPHYYQIDAITSYLSGTHSYKYTICFLNNKTQIPQIEVLGKYRYYLKIASKNLPPQYLVALCGFGQYSIDLSTPTYVWLRYDNRSMKIVLH